MSYEMPIKRDKIREFARATQSKNLAYFETAPTIPATFLTIARLAWEPRAESAIAQLGFDMRRVLHGEEEYVFHGPPPRAGQTLRVVARLGERWGKEGERGGATRYARVVNEFRDERGKLVAEQRSIVVETARPPKSEEKA